MPIRRRKRSQNTEPQTLEARALLTTITVTSLEDNLASDGEVTLREALQAANTDRSVDGSAAGDGEDRIEFDPDLKGVLRLDASLGSLVASTDLTIVGNGRGGATVINGGGADLDVIQVGADDITVAIQRLEIKNATTGVSNHFEDSVVRLYLAQLTDNTFGMDVQLGKGVVTRTIVKGNRHGLFVTGERREHSDRLVVKNSQIINNEQNRASFEGGAGIYLDNASAKITNTEISGNTLNRSGRGAGLFATGDRDHLITIENTDLRDNTIESNGNSYGGAIFIERASASIASSTIADNSVQGSNARGAAVAIDHTAGVTGYLLVTDTNIHGNSTTAENNALGGAIHSVNRRLTLDRVSIHSNTLTGANAVGGGIFATASDLNLSNSTVSGNTVSGSSGAGDAITVRGHDNTVIQNSTIVSDTSGVSIINTTRFSQDVALYSNIISSSGVDLELDLNGSGTVVIERNLIGSNELSGLDAAPPGNPDADGNMIGTADARIDPMLDPLADNGGGTLTHKPQTGSPVIGAGGNEQSHYTLLGPFEFDQRGEPYSRESDAVDIGAIEAGDVFFSVTPVQAELSETDGATATFEVRVLTPNAAPIVIDYESVGITAQIGEDIEHVTGQLTFTDGSEVLQIVVPIVDDARPEFGEEFSVRLSHSDLALGFTRAVVRIAEDTDTGVNVLPGTASRFGGNDIFIRGDESNDVVAIEASGDDFVVTLNGQQETVSNNDVRRVLVHAGDGDDQIDAAGLALPIFVEAGAGADSVTAGDGESTVNGGDGHDTLIGGSQRDLLRGDAGRDLLYGRDGDDWMNGGDGYDTLHGEAGDDILNGHRGNDRIFGGEGNDDINGDLGRDSLEGGAGDDEIHTGYSAEDGGNIAKGGSGNDQINARHAGDLANGGAGDDELESYSVSPVTLLGASGNDTIRAFNGLLSGAEGSDTITLLHHDSVSEVSVDGGPGRDLLRSESRNSNTLIGGAGNDTLQSERGSDRLEGGDGNDKLNGNEGDDVLLGGTGRDRLVGHAGNDVLSGGQDDDTLLGGDGDDSIRGNDGDDIILGQAGADSLRGFEGSDLIIGGTGTDTITGHEGEDILIGGSTTLNQTNLALVLSEWTSNRDQATRAANIRNGSGGGDRANGDAYLDSTTLSDDDANDELLGAEDNDWFFARTGSDTMDDRADDELFDELQ